MYEPLEGKDSNNPNPGSFSENREAILNNLLTNYLKPDKLKEKQNILDKIKYQKHQLEVAVKQLKKDKKLKNPRKKKNLTCKLRKSLNLYKLDKNGEKLEYEKFKVMNELWQQYMNKVLINLNEKSLENLSEESVLQYVKQADLHGAIINVVRSKCKNLIGLRGIVLQEKRNVFVILTKANLIKTIPKHDNLFEIEINECKFTLVGTNMCIKTELRVTKTIKPKEAINIL